MPAQKEQEIEILELPWAIAQGDEVRDLLNLTATYIRDMTALVPGVSTLSLPEAMCIVLAAQLLNARKSPGSSPEETEEEGDDKS